MRMSKALVPQEIIENRIFLIRGHKVMIDRDLAGLFGVLTKNLNLQVKRNKERFPEEFIFQLTKKEKNELVANCNRFATLKHSTSLPYVFTEHGVAMLATVLKSEIAVRMSIHIIKTFVRLRKFVALHKEIAQKINQMEGRLDKHDAEIQGIINAIKNLIAPPSNKTKQIGFRK